VFKGRGHADNTDGQMAQPMSGFIAMCFLESLTNEKRMWRRRRKHKRDVNQSDRFFDFLDHGRGALHAGELPVGRDPLHALS